ncbi:alcohol dehydrogenase catalytic domain-containing protein [Bilifractor porci]|uniref:alcohol dehydrogenase catalytic domain-containing protein n=1 Tax=Bilifractor porci TaxID=2606636 RepID=UPI002ED6691D
MDLIQDYMLGHEAAGIVIEVSEGVTNIKVGDRVCLEPDVTDGTCEFCKAGKYNLDPDGQFLATPPVRGCKKRFIEFPADY